MKFGVREICNVVFRATQTQYFGDIEVKKGQPVLYIDTAKTSSMESSATTVYAQGGRGNTRLIAWEGEKTLTFTVEDALLSPISFAMLSGAGLIKSKADSEEIMHFHQTTALVASSEDGSLDLTNALEENETIDINAPFFILKTDKYGDLTGEIVQGNYIIDPTNNQKLVLKEVSASSITGGVGMSEIATVSFPAKKQAGESDTEAKKRFKAWNEVAVLATSTDPDNPLDWSYAEPMPVAVLTRSDANYGFNADTTSAFRQKLASLFGTSNVLYFNQPRDSFINEVDGSALVLPYNFTKFKVDFTQESASSFPTSFTVTEGSLSPSSVLANKAKVQKTAATMKAEVKAASDAYSIFIDEEAEASAKTAALATVMEFLTIQAALRYYYYKYYDRYISNSSYSNIPDVIKEVFKPSAEATGPKYYVYRDGQYVELETEAAIAGATGTLYRGPGGLGRVAYENKALAYQNFLAIGETAGQAVVLDYYVTKKAATISELQIDAANFAGYYYVEADTLFRRQSDGKDLPANITFPNVKIQSNFTFSMAPTGDPSTFTFTMDAMPGYTYFDKSKKVLCAIQIVDDVESVVKPPKTVFGHPAGIIDESKNDSTPMDYYD